METSLTVEDFYLLNTSIEAVTTTKVTTISTEGGLLSPLLRLLFGTWVQTKTTTTISTKQELSDSANLSDSMLECELEQLLAESEPLEVQTKTITHGYVGSGEYPELRIRTNF